MYQYLQEVGKIKAKYLYFAITYRYHILLDISSRYRYYRLILNILINIRIYYLYHEIDELPMEYGYKMKFSKYLLTLYK